MGFAVDDTVEFPSRYVPGEVGHHDQCSWSRPYVSDAARFAELRRPSQPRRCEDVSDSPC
jgi:hypothetical protein